MIWQHFKTKSFNLAAEVFYFKYNIAIYWYRGEVNKLGSIYPCFVLNEQSLHYKIRQCLFMFIDISTERELEILQSLEDLNIQEGQNAVFMCEVSLDDVPGEWFKNGVKIKPTSTIKIRQEGYSSTCC